MVDWGLRRQKLEVLLFFVMNSFSDALCVLCKARGLGLQPLIHLMLRALNMLKIRMKPNRTRPKIPTNSNVINSVLLLMVLSYFIRKMEVAQPIISVKGCLGLNMLTLNITALNPGRVSKVSCRGQRVSAGPQPLSEFGILKPKKIFQCA